MRVKGLSKKDFIDLGKWYAELNGKVKSTINPAYPGITTIDREPKINIITMKLGYYHFEKMLRECHEFNSTINLESLDPKEQSFKLFKSIDRNGNEVVIDFSHGDIIDFPPSLKIMDGNNCDTLLYYFNFNMPTKDSHKMNDKDYELYDKVISKQQLHK